MKDEAAINRAISVMRRHGRTVNSANLPDLPSLAQVEAAHIERVLEACDGNRTRAALVLGIDRRSLYRKLRGAK